MPARAVAALGVLAVLAACTTGGEPASPPRRTERAQPTQSRVERPEPQARPTPEARFDRRRAYATVRTLAGRIGPREATSPAFRRAADLVATRFDHHGYVVTRPELRVPAGVSWGVPVDAGRTTNVVARPFRLDLSEPHVVVGAHLDTVPQAPGAEDNASGVAVLLELARMAAADPPPVPVVFVAFGAEEPRGEGDDAHHFGSRAYVRAMSRAERQALVGMVSLDRVGVGPRVPICTGGVGPTKMRARLRAAARRVEVPAVVCSDNQASDHWSFEKAGLPAARLGSTPYAAYHSESDLPRVVNPFQLRRTGRVAWEALTSRG